MNSRSFFYDFTCSEPQTDGFVESRNGYHNNRILFISLVNSRLFRAKGDQLIFFNILRGIFMLKIITNIEHIVSTINDSNYVLWLLLLLKIYNRF